MPKKIITIDCETLPTALPFDTPGIWKDEEEFESTALDGTFGRLLCIGYTREWQQEGNLEYGCFGWNSELEKFDSDETSLLTAFWEMMADFNVAHDIIVGHNIMDFDLPFIVKRSIINGVRPTQTFSFARYRNRPIFDTMREWDCWSYKNWTSLGKLAIALGLPSPKDGNVTGGGISEAYSEGKHREIYEYCMRDVKTTRNIFRKMNFTYPTERRATAESVT